MKMPSGLGMLSLLAMLALGPAVRAQTDDGPKEPRLLGQKAVLHIYYYAPKTLEITFVDSYLFKDEGTCRDAISRALQIAALYAGGGDLVNARCVGMNPPPAPEQRAPQDPTEL
jgi:hypothetical protein